jgi:hypothetical protein
MILKLSSRQQAFNSSKVNKQKASQLCLFDIKKIRSNVQLIKFGIQENGEQPEGLCAALAFLNRWERIALQWEYY